MKRVALVQPSATFTAAWLAPTVDSGFEAPGDVVVDLQLDALVGFTSLALTLTHSPDHTVWTSVPLGPWTSAPATVRLTVTGPVHRYLQLAGSPTPAVAGTVTLAVTVTRDVALVTLPQAKDHLRITATDGDADLTLKLAQAEALILDYCRTTAYWRGVLAAWTVETVPAVMAAAILLQLGELWRFRGDDLGSEGPARDPALGDLAPVVVSLLRRTRDAVMA